MRNFRPAVDDHSPATDTSVYSDALGSPACGDEADVFFAGGAGWEACVPYGYLGGFPCTGVCPVQDARLVSTAEARRLHSIDHVASRGLLFAWKRVYLLAIDMITASVGNHLGFVSGAKLIHDLGWNALSP